MLRHCVATLAYRGGKALREAPDHFVDYRVVETSRTPGQILAHLADLLDWALEIARGGKTWKPVEPLGWERDINRFFVALAAFDDFLASEAPLSVSEEQLFQGPIADALTHVGQLAMLRRMAGAPIRGENYFKAKIETGRVGSDQEPARVEFD